MSTPDRKDFVELINYCCSRLPVRELMVLSTIAERLVMGLEQYGPLSPGKKNWRREAKEEALDMAVYLACELEEGEE